MNFSFINRRVNPFGRMDAPIPAHRLLSRRLALITVTGRRSGRIYTLPVGYSRTPEGVAIQVAAPEAKRWWRNLRSPVPVELFIDGASFDGTGQALESDGGVTVAVKIDR